MQTRTPRHSKEEFRRRGEDIYERLVKPTLQPDDNGKLVAIDIESGEFELARRGYDAAQNLFARIPDAQIWLARVGHPAAVRIGFGVSRTRQMP